MMGEPSRAHFPLIDRFTGIQMDVQWAAVEPGQVDVVESTRRLRRELSYGFIHALVWFWLADGRVAVSVPPGAGEAVRCLLGSITSIEEMLDPGLAARLKEPVDAALSRAGLGPSRSVQPNLAYACNAALVRRHAHGDRLCLTDERLPAAEGLRLPTHCFPNGLVFGVVEGGQVVSVAYAHRTGLMEDQVADLGVETAERHRRCGYAQTVVSAVVTEITRSGGEAVYFCGSDNLASMATARSVGFVLYGTVLVLPAPADDVP